LFSAVSAWEMVIKSRWGRLEFIVDPVTLITEQIIANSFTALPIEIRHTLQVFKLPLVHRDPFDRLLVAQAIVEAMPLLTGDPAIARYDVSTVW
jgi:PIN domain nuclease of toxin-antitoxin system